MILLDELNTIKKYGISSIKDDILNNNLENKIVKDKINFQRQPYNLFTCGHVYYVLTRNRREILLLSFGIGTNNVNDINYEYGINLLVLDYKWRVELLNDFYTVYKPYFEKIKDISKDLQKYYNDYFDMSYLLKYWEIKKYPYNEIFMKISQKTLNESIIYEFDFDKIKYCLKFNPFFIDSYYYDKIEKTKKMFTNIIS